MIDELIDRLRGKSDGYVSPYRMAALATHFDRVLVAFDALAADDAARRARRLRAPHPGRARSITALLERAPEAAR